MGSAQPLPAHLQSDHDIHVIISILSGRHNAQAYYDESLRPFLDSYELRYTVHVTKSAQTIVELTRDLFLPSAQAGKKQTIVLLSGDGGIVDVVNTLANAQSFRGGKNADFVRPIVALMPQGTANALAWSSGVASDPLQILTEGKPELLPIFKVTFSPGSRLVTNEGADREVIVSDSGAEPVMHGAVVFSWGLHASLVHRSDTTEYRKHGIERFTMVAQELLKENHAYNGNVQIVPRTSSATPSSMQPIQPVDESSKPPTHAYVLASLVSNLEEKFKINPASKPLDGKLRVIGIKHLPGDVISRILFAAYQDGKHVEDENVVYEEIDGLQIEMLEEEEEGRIVCVDGKIVVVERGGRVRVDRVPKEQLSVVQLVR